MLYAHIYNDFGTFKAEISRWVKFKNPQEEEKISKNLIATIPEETGDELLLEKKIIDYAANSGLRIEGYNYSPRHLKLLDEVAKLPDADRIEMLETSVKNLAALLERERRTAYDLIESLKQARAHSEKQVEIAERLVYILEMQNDIIKIAEEELECEHIEQARGIYWERRARTDC